MKPKSTKNIADSQNQKNQLCELARNALFQSYSPYSKKKVGAAVLTKSGQIYTGCNIENSSFGATVCAERVAIQNAVSAGHKEILEIAVASEGSPPWPPCGMCRQVLAEFCESGLKVFLINLKGECMDFEFDILFPYAFKLTRNRF